MGPIAAALRHAGTAASVINSLQHALLDAVGHLYASPDVGSGLSTAAGALSTHISRSLAAYGPVAGAWADTLSLAAAPLAQHIARSSGSPLSWQAVAGSLQAAWTQLGFPAAGVEAATALMCAAEELAGLDGSCPPAAAARQLQAVCDHLACAAQPLQPAAADLARMAGALLGPHDGQSSSWLPEVLAQALPLDLHKDATVLSSCGSDPRGALAAALSVANRHASGNLGLLGSTPKLGQDPASLLTGLADSLVGAPSDAVAGQLAASAVAIFADEELGSHLQALLRPDATPANIVLGAASLVGTAALLAAKSCLSDEQLSGLRGSLVSQYKQLERLASSPSFNTDAALWLEKAKRPRAVCVIGGHFQGALRGSMREDVLTALRGLCKAGHSGDRLKAVKVGLSV